MENDANDGEDGKGNDLDDQATNEHPTTGLLARRGIAIDGKQEGRTTGLRNERENINPNKNLGDNRVGDESGFWANVGHPGATVSNGFRLWYLGQTFDRRSYKLEKKVVEYERGNHKHGDGCTHLQQQAEQD